MGSHSKGNDEKAPMMRSVRPRLTVIHTSDVHLESDSLGMGPAGERLRRQVRDAFSRVIDLAISERAALMLLVGDLFDSNRVEPEALEFAFGELRRARLPVVMVPGNHDVHDESSLYAAIPPEQLPPNLHLILSHEGTRIEFPDLNVSVWGRAMAEHSPAYRPLQGLPPPRPGFWNIALAHGFFSEDGELARSSPVTSEEIASSGYDYVALGHVHVFRDLSQGSTGAAYSGAPAPSVSGQGVGSVARVVLEPESGAIVEPLHVMID